MPSKALELRLQYIYIFENYFEKFRLNNFLPERIYVAIIVYYKWADHAHVRALRQQANVCATVRTIHIFFMRPLSEYHGIFIRQLTVFNVIGNGFSDDVTADGRVDMAPACGFIDGLVHGITNTPL